MSDNRLARIRMDGVQCNSDLPTVPDAFMRTDYEGWLGERVKRFQLKAYERTQAERIVVLRQINQLQAECLALARNQANWRHLQQEDRIRKKRLDLDEMEINFRMEEVLDRREERLRDRMRASVPPPPTPKTSDPVEEITRGLERAIRAEVGVKEVFAKAREAHPHLSSWIDEWEAKVTWDLRERKWF